MVDEKSLSDDATLAGKAKRRPASEVSLGEERTLGDNRSGHDTVTDDIEVVDLEARYRVEGTLGQGGMGAVLLATDTRLDRKVAIKRILGEAAGNRMAVQRFLTEAKAIAALNHPNIVQIYDYGRAKDGPFLIMEYVDGGSLLDRCRESALPLDEAIDLACQLCDGLAKAHDLGIIHRDIKPANVLLTKDGIPKLTDFGLAKAQAGDHGQTMTGAVIGTPDFMPPEQRRDASEVDARSDLWSLAATVYQMVTGRSPKIIRFKDVPESIQEVLGKALEDHKDSRYQTARELRHALKTSLLVRAPSAAVPDVLEGKCPACGVQNDSSRRFCRGCGESLDAPCLSCDKPMPMWEEICGLCGGKQAPLVDERRRAMAARQAEAEGLLGDFEFDRAVGIATQLRDEAHPRLKHLAGWGASFLEQIEKARAEQTRHAVEAMAEAGKHVAEYDYLSANFALEMVPDSLRAGVLPGMRESAATMLDRIQRTQREASRLEARIKERLVAKQLDELLPDVESLLTLWPDREDLKTIRMQLLERQQKQAGARDTALELAKARLASHDYEAALAVVSGVAPTMITPEVVALREQAESLVRQVRGLAVKIKAAVTAKQFDGLLDVVHKYLTLKPADVEIGKLRQSLVEREEKYAGDIAARLQQAEQLEQACRFDEAKKLLTAIPEPRRTKRVAACLSRANRLSSLQRSAMTALGAATFQTYHSAIQTGRDYASALAAEKLSDAQFAGLLAQTDAAREQAERSRRIIILTGAVATGIAMVVTMVAAGVWIRSSMRAAWLTSAISQSRWDDALAIEPENFAALVGRARTKLQASPPDIAGAFVDLDRAESGRGLSREGKAARGDGHALQALELAKTDRLDDAGKDLVQASRLGAAADLVTAAREALMAGWVDRARAASEKGDVPRLKRAVKAALGAGAAEELLLTAWEIYARARIAAFDAAGLTLACEEGVRLGLSDETQAGWWLRIAEKAVQPPHEDTVVLRTALKAAKAAGATEADLAPLQARGLLLEAVALVVARDMRTATAKTIEATLLDMTSAVTVLKIPANQAMREFVAADYRDRFNAGLSSGDWDSVLPIAAAACALDETASGWVSAAIAKHPGGLSTVPPEALSRLPAATIAKLPPATIAALPPKTIAVLSPETIAALSPPIIAALPSASLAALAPAAITALPPLRNSVGIELKLLPPGRFTMGEGSEGHQVTLTKPFYMGVHEVTNAQWQRVMGSVPSNWKDGDSPVEQVSWADAMEFCLKLSALPLEREAGRVYRLPTEAEWEYACRAGSTSRYSFGDDESRLEEYAWYDRNSSWETHLVGKKKANAWGLFDMHGNVGEWCSDWHVAYASGAVTDPQGRPGGADRVIRGGHWSHPARSCRSAYRNGYEPSFRYDFLGFRLAAAAAVAASGGLESHVEPLPRNLPETIKNSIGVALKLLPAGTFTMGEAGVDSDQTPHQVTLTKPFYIGVHEVTNAQWERVMGSVPSRWKAADRPVENVSWEDAVEFCRKLSALPEEHQAGRVYGLPTEAEWEYACRAQSKTAYSFGDDDTLVGDYAWYDGNSGGETHAVGQKKPNAWGLYDMHGNVWEWVNDWYDPAYYTMSTGPDPQGPVVAGARVNRGGSWGFTAGGGRSAIRGKSDPSNRHSFLGFRLALRLTSVQRAPVGDQTANAGIAWSSLISPETLGDEVKQMRAAVVPAVASASAFKGGGYDTARKSFSAIALAFGVIAAHEKDAQWKNSAETARDLFARAGFNCKVGTDQSFAEAEARVTDLESLIEGKPIALRESREQDFRWSQVASRPSLMSRLETADGMLGGAIASQSEFQNQVQRFIHEAEIVAVIGEVIMQPDFEYHDDATYRGFASTLRDAAAKARDAAQKNDYESARTAVGELLKACGDCHGDYRR